MKKALILIKNIVVTLLLIVLAVQVVQMVARKVSPEKYPKIFGYSKAVVLTGSMTPTLMPGDLVYYKECKTYEVEDIILFYDEDFEAFVTHRIKRTETGENGEILYRTAGDYTQSIDSNPVKQEHIQGKVVKVIPNMGKVLNFFQSPAGMAVLLFAALLFIFLPNIIAWIKGGEEEHGSNDSDATGGTD